jgi:hypothetical protein
MRAEDDGKKKAKKKKKKTQRKVLDYPPVPPLGASVHTVNYPLTSAIIDATFPFDRQTEWTTGGAAFDDFHLHSFVTAPGAFGSGQIAGCSAAGMFELSITETDSQDLSPSPVMILASEEVAKLATRRAQNKFAQKRLRERKKEDKRELELKLTSIPFLMEEVGGLRAKVAWLEQQNRSYQDEILSFRQNACARIPKVRGRGSPRTTRRSSVRLAGL